MTALNEVLTVTEAAQLYGITRDTVHKAIQAGSIPARQSVKTWLILRVDAEERWGKKEIE